MIQRKAWSGIIPVIVLSLITACSSSNNSNSNNNAQPAASVAATGQRAGTGAPLSDCAYTAKIQEAFVPIQAAALQQITLATPGAGGSAADAPANLLKVLDAITMGLNQGLAILQKVTPPADFQAFQANFLAAIQTTSTQVNDAKTAFAAGDISKADALFSSGESSFGSEFAKLQQQYPDLTARLDACPAPTP